MIRVLLDTDHVSLHERGHLPLRGRLASFPPEEVAVSVVTVEEMLRGRLAILHERLAYATQGQGQVVGLVGEPGMGKSRLLYECAQSLPGQAVTYHEGHCLAYGSATPYLAVRDLLRQHWGSPRRMGQRRSQPQCAGQCRRPR